MTQLELQVLDSLDDMKVKNVVVLDVRGKTFMTDCIIIAGASSGRHAKAAAERLISDMRDHGVRPLGVEGLEAPSWVLVDLCDVVVHIMQEEARQFYALEQLWGAV